MLLQPLSTKAKGLVLFVCCIILLVTGGIIGYFQNDTKACYEGGSGNSHTLRPRSDDEDSRFALHSKLLDEMRAAKILDEAKYLSSTPHMSGTIYSKRQAEHVADKWRKYGVENVKVHKYDVLLSYPKESGRLSVSFLNGSLRHFNVQNDLKFTGNNYSDVVLPYNAYSPSGKVTSPLVYANYGFPSDFHELKKKGINVTGKIVMIRHGFPYRGQQLDYAHLNGAIGVIFYSDPQQFNPNGKGAQFPKGWELPDSAMHIGTLIERPGDPLTREFPSKQGFYRTDVSKAAPLPKIPSQPIPFEYARVLLQEMDGIAAPANFKGHGSFTYRLNASFLVNLNVQTELKTKTIYVVSGIIYGDKEPDRLILVGNHRDSWQYGASDASGAQATLMEIARSLGKARKTGWRPRRSILILSWDAHEQGIHGSTEWVEEYSSMISEQAVAYLNVDVAVDGNHTIDLKATPELNDVFYDVTKYFTEPKTNKNLYRDWLMKRPSNTGEEPRTLVLITGSDYKPFYHTIGVSCVDFRYTYATTPGTKYPFSNPMFHSVVDNYKWMTLFIDQDFRYHLLVGKIWLKLALNLADSTILPFNLTRAAKTVYEYAKVFQKIHEVYLRPKNLSCDMLVSAALDLYNAAGQFEKTISSKVDRESELKVRMVNDRIQNFQRQFIHQSGTMGRDDLKNVVYSTRWDLMTTRTRFTSISHAIFRATNGKDNNWDEVKKQVMITTHRLQTAAESFKGF